MHRTIVRNYKLSITVMRDLSILSQASLASLDDSPILANPLLQHPLSPIVQLYKPLLICIGYDKRGLIRYSRGQSERLTPQYSDRVVGQIERILPTSLALYGKMNPGVRYALVGRWLERWVVDVAKKIRGLSHSDYLAKLAKLTNFS